MPAETGGRRFKKHWISFIPESGILWNNNWRKMPILLFGRPNNRTKTLAAVGPIIRKFQGADVVPNVAIYPENRYHGLGGVVLPDLLKGHVRFKRGVIFNFKHLGFAGEKKYRNLKVVVREKPYDQK